MADKNRVLRFVDQFGAPAWGLATRLSRGHGDTSNAEDERYPDKAGTTTFIGANLVLPSSDGHTVHVNFNEGLNPDWRAYQSASRHFADVEDLGADFAWTLTKTVTPPIDPPPSNETELQIVTRVRKKYPTPLGTTHAAFLFEVAKSLGKGAGLYVKNTGTNILLPDGTRVSQDIIAYRSGHGYDCLGSGETLAIPMWSHVNVNGVDVLLDDIATRYYAVGP